MPIRKYGTEPAKVETRTEDNDQETMRSLGATGDVYDPNDENPHHKKSENSGGDRAKSE